MTSTGGFDAEQGFPVFRLSFRAVAEGIAGNGTKPGGMALSHSSGMDVSVSSGTAVYGGGTKDYGGSTLTVPAADPDDDRWDAVLFDFPAGSVRVEAGTPEQYPSPPAPGADDVVIGYVYVAAGSTSLDPSWVLDWTAQPADASDLVVSDPNGVYPSENLAGALWVLETAAKISQYPLALGDLDSPYAPADIASFSSYPLANSDIANPSLTVNAGAALTTTNASVGLGGSATLDVSGVTDSEIDAGTTISRSKIDDERDTTGPHTADTTTSGEEVLLVDTSGGPVTVTLASADANEGNFVTVVDVGGAAGADPITIETEGSELIDGGSEASVDTDYGAFVLASDGANWYGAGGGASGGAVSVSNNGTGVVSNASSLDAGAALNASSPAPNKAVFDVDSGALGIPDSPASQDRFDGDHTGEVSDGSAEAVGVYSLSPNEGVEVRRASLSGPLGGPAPDGVSLVLASLDGAGGYTSEETALSSDGSSALVGETSTDGPLADASNTGDSPLPVAVLVDNSSGASAAVHASFVGRGGLPGADPAFVQMLGRRGLSATEVSSASGVDAPTAQSITRRNNTR